jgi:hypothetical protein
LLFFIIAYWEYGKDDSTENPGSKPGSHARAEYSQDQRQGRMIV